MIFEIIVVAAAVLGGVVIAWAIETVVPIVVDYLKRKKLEDAIISKGKAINDWFEKTDDPEIIAELEAIKKAQQALLAPRDKSGRIYYGEIVVIKPQSVEGEDRMSDKTLIRRDGSHQELQY